MRTKKRKTIISIFLTVVIILTLPSQFVFAYSRLGYKLSGSFTSILYYLDSSTNEYKDSINNGYEFWNGASKVKIYRTDTKADSRCDSYWGNYFPSGSNTIAATSFYLNNQVTNPTKNDWYWCQIKYNSDVYKYEADGGLSYFNRQGTACHEFGHVLGLDHTNSISTNVMCQLGSGRSVNCPSTDDKNGIKAIYGQP